MNKQVKPNRELALHYYESAARGGSALAAGKVAEIQFRGETPLAESSAAPPATKCEVALSLQGGELSGQRLDSKLPSISVPTGGRVVGVVQVRTRNDLPSSAIVPFGITPTWGDPKSAAQKIAGHVGNGSKTYGIKIDMNAPQAPGQHFLVFAISGTYNTDQIMSGTHPAWQADWQRGNKVARQEASVYQTAIRQGWVPFDWYSPEGTKSGTMGMTAIEVNVTSADAGSKPQLLSNVEQPFHSSLVAYYPLNGSAIDAGKNKLDGDIKGVQFSEGRENLAGDFNGHDSYIRLSPRLVGGNRSGTFAAWVYLRSFPRNNAIIASQGQTDCTHFLVSVSPERKISVHMCGRNGAETFNGRDSVPMNSWFLLAFTWESGAWRSYINTRLDNSMAASLFPESSEDDFKLGRHEHISGAFYLDGMIDDIRIYSRALTGEEIRKLADFRN